VSEGTRINQKDDIVEKVPQYPSSMELKPRTEHVRPELTRLPPLTLWRRLIRRVLRGIAWIIVKVTTRAQVTGLENIPKQGPALVVSNHLGDADVPVAIALLPSLNGDMLAKIDLYIDYPPLGWLMDAYGVIWVHRGSPDRRALRVALQALAEGRFVGLSPEGRESISGSLEEGTGGAAYLALKADVPILPITLTGTENTAILNNLKQLRRSNISVTVGPVFRLDMGNSWRESVQQGTQRIMLTLARQLPPQYRGVYKTQLGNEEDRGKQV
jgi:1-acyl-sn-glycerol-3-phosphate acyltransferase